MFIVAKSKGRSIYPDPGAQSQPGADPSPRSGATVLARSTTRLVIGLAQAVN